MELANSSEDGPLEFEDEISQADDESVCLDIEDANDVVADNPGKWVPGRNHGTWYCGHGLEEQTQVFIFNAIQILASVPFKIFRCLAAALQCAKNRFSLALRIAGSLFAISSALEDMVLLHGKDSLQTLESAIKETGVTSVSKAGSWKKGQLPASLDDVAAKKLAFVPEKLSEGQKVR